MRRRIAIDDGQMINHINWKHIDGPMLARADGSIRWLTLKERVLCWLGAVSFFEMNPVAAIEAQKGGQHEG